MAISPLIPIQQRGGRRTTLIPLAGPPAGDGCYLCDFSTGSLPNGFSFSRSGTAWFVNSNGYLQSADSGVARFEYDPSQGTPTCRGLVMEPQSTNLALQSANIYEELTWIQQGDINVTNNSVNCPDNVSRSVVQFMETEDVVSGPRVRQIIGTSAGQAYTFSFWVKPEATNAFGFELYWNSNYWLKFNVLSVLQPLGSGVHTLTSASQMTISLRREVYKDGWYRYSISFTHPSGVTIQNGVPITPNFDICIQSTEAYFNTGARMLSIFGVQFETGTGSTSYIPTTTGTATRNQDSLTLSDISGLNFNTANSSFVIKGVQRSHGTSYARTFRIAAPSVSESIALPVDGVTLFGSSRNGSSAIVAEGTKTNTLLADFAFGFSVDTSLTTAAGVSSLNGTTSTHNRQNAGPLATPTQLLFNHNSSATAYASMIIRSLKYCPVSRTSSEMTALTTL